MWTLEDGVHGRYEAGRTNLDITSSRSDLGISTRHRRIWRWILWRGSSCDTKTNYWGADAERDRGAPKCGWCTWLTFDEYLIIEW